MGLTVIFTFERSVVTETNDFFTLSTLKARFVEQQALNADTFSGISSLAAACAFVESHRAAKVGGGRTDTGSVGG